MSLRLILTISFCLLSLSAIAQDVSVPASPQIDGPIIFGRGGFNNLPSRQPYSFDLNTDYDLSQRPQLVPYTGPVSDVSRLVRSLPTVNLDQIDISTLSGEYRPAIGSINYNYNREPNCPYFNILDPANLEIITNVMGQCDSLASANRYDPAHSIFSQIDNFRAVCACYDDPNSLQGAAASGARPPRVSGRLFSRNQLVTDEPTVSANVSTEAYLLRNLVEGVQLQASFLSPNINEAQRLSQAYAQNYLREGRSESEALRDARRSLAGRYRALRFSGEPKLPNLEFNRGILTGWAKDKCVSERDFAAVRQFPPEPAFYTDLASYNINSCRGNCDDWDYDKLKTQLENLTRGRILTLGEAQTNPETSQIIRRLDFLHRNPMIKNFLAANMQTAEKQQVVRMIQENFSGNQSTAIRNSNRFRETFSRFMGDPQFPRRVNEVKEEGKRQFNRLLRELPERATTTQHLATAEDLISITPSFFENSRALNTGLFRSQLSGQPLPGSIIAMTDPVDVRARRMEGIGRICPKIQNGDLFRNSYVFNELERQWTREANIEENDGVTLNLDAFQSSVCNQRRATPGSAPVDYDDWIQTRCGQDASCRTDRRARVAEFVRAHPISNSTFNPDPAEAFANLQENAPIIDLPEDAAQVAGQIGSQSATANRNETAQILRGDYVIDYPSNGGGSGGGGGGANLSNLRNSVAATPSSVTSSTPSTSPQTNSNSQSNSQNQLGGFVPSSEVPLISAPLAEARAQTQAIRSQVRQSETESVAIRDQLADLRETFQRENAQPPEQRDNTLIQNLNDRLASLETSLETKDREASDLRRRLARAESQERVLAPQTPDSQQSSDRRSQIVSGGVTPQTSLQGGPQNLNANSGGGSPQAQFGGFSPVQSIGQARSIIGGQMNAALLSRYNVQSVSAQSRGAIIVADPGSATDYQQLRADAGESSVQLNFSEADYNRFAINESQALEAYLAQVQGAPGEVVRVVITRPGTTETVERFILKSEGRVTIVSQPGVSRAPAGSQRYRLSDLVNELQGR